MSKSLFARPAALAAVVTLLAAQPGLADDEHHPDAPPAPSTAQRMPGSQGMPDSMRQMQQMTGMMGQSGTGGMGMDVPIQMMTEHVEGRIAFLRTELKITASQTAAWDRFADALRANSKRLSETGAMGGRMGAGAGGLPQRVAREEQMLEARLDGVKRMRAAIDQLYAVLIDEQKTLAENLAPPHLGMMPMGRM